MSIDSLTAERVRYDIPSPTIGPASYAYIPSFPSAALLKDMRILLPSMAKRWDGHEGPRALLTLAAGAVGITRRDYAKRERTHERGVKHRIADVDQLAAELNERGRFPERPAPRQEIKSWSRKSRANMVKSLCEIDYVSPLSDINPHGPMLRRGRVPAMVTLTYSGDWLTVAPNGKAAKRHLQLFFKRYWRAWGEKLKAVWKLEFQRRGAPHFHLLMVPPHGKARAGVAAGRPFKFWLSAVWASIVNHPDPEEYSRHLKRGTNVNFSEGLRAKDPKRVAVYFTKHGAFRAKEYQNCVPVEWQGPGDGPGRFWGYRYVKRYVVGIELYEHDRIIAARTLRRWARAQGATRQVPVLRTPGGRVVPVRWDVIGLAGVGLLADGRPGRMRSARRRVRRLSSGAGWVSVNNGARFAAELGRYFELVYSWALASPYR